MHGIAHRAAVATGETRVRCLEALHYELAACAMFARVASLDISWSSPSWASFKLDVMCSIMVALVRKQGFSAVVAALHSTRRISRHLKPPWLEPDGPIS